MDPKLAKTIAVFILIFTVLFYTASLRWVVSLEKKECECSKDWRRTYMKYFYVAIFGYITLIISAVVFPKSLGKAVQVLNPFASAASIVYVAVALSYTADLRRHVCDCAKGRQETFIFWTTLCQTIFIATGLLLKGEQMHFQ